MCKEHSANSGDDGVREPPVLIPNTEVKPYSADGTWLETAWESRALPDFFYNKAVEIRLTYIPHVRQQREADNPP